MPAKTTKAPTPKAATTTAKAVEPEKEMTVEVAEPVTRKKVFKDDDRIPCMSITAGKYVAVGDKSGEVYRWLTDGDTVDVKYSDLLAAVRMRKPMVFKPRVVVEDEDFLADHKELQELYDSLYSADDLKAILQLSPAEMKKVVPNLPDGVKDSLKTLAIKAIDEGRLDSVQRVRVLDDIFGTDMLLKLTS